MTDSKKPNWRKRFFNWHMWTGIIFTIPILLVSITAILIAHEKGLGTKEIAVKAGWLPGYSSDKSIAHYLDDVKAVAITENASYYGTKLGVVLENNSKQLSIVKGTEGKEVRDFLLLNNQLWIATKYGLFLSNNNEAKLIKKGDFHGIDINNTTFIASEGKHGFWTSTDAGKTWISKKISKTSDAVALESFTNSISQSDFIEELTLEKLVLDIHTGKAFFGDGSMWVWIDLVGLSLLLMTLTGMWMWYKRKYGKKKKR